MNITKEDRKTFIKEIVKDDTRKELEKNNIIIKNNSFTLTEDQKRIVEEKYNYNFTKKYFNTKNSYLYNIIKKTLEDQNYTFYTSKELEEKIKEKTEEKIAKELEEEEEKTEEK
jgi:hypothetical protein